MKMNEWNSFRQSAEFLPIGIYVTDGSRCLFVNQAAENLLGCDADQLTTKWTQLPVTEFQLNNSEPSFTVQAMIEGHSFLLLDLHVKRVQWDKQHFWIVTLSRSTEVNHVNMAVDTLNNRLRALFDNHDSPILFFDKSGQLLDYNPAFLTFVGMSEKELMLYGWRNLFSEATFANGVRMFEEMQLKQKPIRYEGPVGWRRGPALHMLISLIPVFSDNQFQGAYYIYNDITDHKNIEDVLKLREKRFEHLIQHASDVFIIVNEQYKIKYVSESVTSVAGYQIDKLLGASTFSFIHPDDVNVVIESYKKLQTEEDRIEKSIIRLLRADETYGYFEVTRANLLNESSIEGYILTLRDVTEFALREQRLSKLAYYDSLTNVYNRRYWEQQFQLQLLKHRLEKAQFAVMCIDLDNLKTINDQYGHATGDAFLREVSARMVEGLPEDALLARLGGDEFSLLLPGFSDEETVRSFITPFLKSVGIPCRIDHQKIEVSLSIGVSLYPQHGETQEELMSSADKALYTVKKNGKNGFSIYAHT
jgi:diguanylate cyclase (GGDEF)-like protein/PAS domain S-box-containing protein